MERLQIENGRGVQAILAQKTFEMCVSQGVL